MNILSFIHRHLWLLPVTAISLILYVDIGICEAVDLGTPVLSEPLQQEKFFDTERLTIKGEPSTTPGGFEPQVGLSHTAREDEAMSGGKHTTQSIHGEAGGKLNLSDSLSLTGIARIPLYTLETKDLASSAEERVTSDLLGKPGDISWRSELGVNLGAGIDLNLFYDKSVFGRGDKPGVDEQDEKFGTRFIIRFK